MSRGLVVAMALALTASGCGGELRRLARDVEHLRRIMRTLDCGDGAPVRLLTDPRCPDGICGISCAPDRWWARPPFDDEPKGAGL
jgi:hypothetical protein